MTTNLCPSCMCMTNDGQHTITGEILPSRNRAEEGTQFRGPGDWKWTVVLTIDCLRRKNLRPQEKRTRIMLDLADIDKDLAALFAARMEEERAEADLEKADDPDAWRMGPGATTDMDPSL